MNEILAWFARNRVAAHLLKALIVIAGLLSLGSLRQEVVPEVPSNLISVTIPYPGAAPEEVETAVCNRIEERVQDVTTVERRRAARARNAHDRHADRVGTQGRDEHGCDQPGSKPEPDKIHMLTCSRVT